MLSLEILIIISKYNKSSSCFITFGDNAVCTMKNGSLCEMALFGLTFIISVISILFGGTFFLSSQILVGL